MALQEYVTIDAPITAKEVRISLFWKNYLRIHNILVVLNLQIDRLVDFYGPPEVQFIKINEHFHDDWPLTAPRKPQGLFTSSYIYIQGTIEH